MKIESNDTNIETLLSSNFFEIPQFQRPYSWEDENFEDFWTDIIENQGDDYFIGSMVVYLSGRQLFGVVDGQQRLTTITILLCVIRDFFLENQNEELAKGLHQLIERFDRDNVGSFVLKTETSYPYFQDSIQSISAPALDILPGAEELRIEAAYQIFRKKVESIIEELRNDDSIAKDKLTTAIDDRLKKLRDSVLFLKIILIELDNEDDAYLVFETLNTRGKDLALSDLLKNLFTKLLKKKSDVDFAKIHWEQILEELRNSSADLDPDVFFTHSWASRFVATTQKKAYKKIKGTVTKTTAREHLKSFKDDAKYYRAVFEPNYMWDKSEARIASSLAALQMFKVTQQTPATLALVRAYKKKLIKNGRLRKALAAIENFHFVFTAVSSSRSSGGISAMYTSFGRKLFEAIDSNQAADEIDYFTEKLRDKLPSISEFSASFTEIVFTNNNSKQSALVRYILKKVSESEGLAFTNDFSELTIEHIHPQSKISNEWDERSIGQIGNLMLLTPKYNEGLKNGEFEKKIDSYRKWAGCVPEFVRSQDNWNPSIVEQRTNMIAELSYNTLWKI